MKVTKVRLLACWDGYCGTCADERPLVLTQSGRFSLRAWWAGEGDEGRPLTMTCRVCGTGVHVPHDEEDDDLELELDAELDDEVVAEAEPVLADAPGAAATAESPVTETPVTGPDPELTAVRTAFATALARVVERSSAATAPAALTAPRTGSHDDTDEALRLLAVGLDARDLVLEPASR